MTPRLKIATELHQILFANAIQTQTSPITVQQGTQWLEIAFANADGILNYDATHPLQPCVMPPAKT